MKNLLLSSITTIALIFGALTSVNAATTSDYESKYQVLEQCDYINPNYCGNNSLTNGLASNQTALFYMYSDKNGHYFLDPLADDENVIFVGLNDYKIDSAYTIDTATLHHGKRFIGTFTDNTLWELKGIQEVKFE